MSETNNIFKDPLNLNNDVCLNNDSEKVARMEKLNKKLHDLQTEHTELREELGGKYNDNGKFDIADYEKETKIHIQQLKKYNELKDLSMKLIQMIADSRQETLRTIMDEMGIDNDN